MFRQVMAPHDTMVRTKNYRSRPMIEAGITLHYDRNHEAETKWIDEKIRDYNFQMRLLEQAKSDSLVSLFRP